MHRAGCIEIKMSYLVNALFSSFMSLQSLCIAAIARNQIQMARLPMVSSYGVCSSFQKSNTVYYCPLLKPPDLGRRG